MVLMTKDPYADCSGKEDCLCNHCIWGSATIPLNLCVPYKKEKKIGRV